MAANPFLRVVIKRIKDKGGWSVVFERIGSGEALTKIAATYECSRHTMYKLLHQKDELWDLFIEARRESAMALAEEATEIVDGLAENKQVTREDVALGKLRVEQRRWLAQAYDRETFGVQQQAVAPVLSIGELHLAVLQAPPKKALPTTAVEVIEEPHAIEAGQ